MSTENLFTFAARNKVRYNTTQGLLSVEDLFDLPLTGKGVNLDDIAKGLNRELKAADGDISFVKPEPKKTTDLQARFDIVKYVISVKMAERDERAAAEAKAVRRQKLLGLLERKHDADLEAKSADEIEKLLKEEV